MDNLITKAETAHMLPGSALATRRQAEVEALRLAAIAARDEAIAAAFRRTGQGLLGAAAAVLRALATFPDRLQTYKALRALSDRELRDIGMTRFDIPRVFDPGFAPRPANDAARGAPRAA